MEKGQILELKIEDMSAEGQGIGKADGFTVFVKDAVVGDVVKAELTKVKKHYGFGRLKAGSSHFALTAASAAAAPTAVSITMRSWP